MEYQTGGNRNPFNYQKVEQIGRDVSTTWIPLTTVADQLNLYGDTSQDDLLYGLELASRMVIEDYIGQSMFPCQYRVYYNAGSLSGTPLTLDLPEVSQSVTIDAVKYWDASNTLQTVASNQYYYDDSGNKVVVATLPTDLNTGRTSPVYCEYTVDASHLANYPVVQQASLLMLMHLYNNRSNTTEKIIREIPFGVSSLLRPYKDLVL
ncbi:MAG: head-tail connector protein [Planctomyces sp.]|jgi:hypothetical protein